MTLFLVALFAAVLAGLIVWLALGKKSAALTERARMADEQGQKSQSELAALRVERDELKTQVARLDTALKAEREALQKTEARFADTFKALSADALKGNNESFLKLAQATLEKFQEGAKGDLVSRQQAIDSLVKPLRESLEKVDGKISEIEKARATAYGSLSEQLKGLAGAQSSLQTETTKLSRSLRSTATAGRWGEIQLQRVVELSGMVENVDFVQQSSGEEGRPDLIVRLPGGKQIAVDAKAPMQAYLEALEATDDNIRKAKFVEHARAVRAQIDALGKKPYWKDLTPSPEFVVLFIPGEAFYAAALRYEPDLFERGISVGVILASPATLIALLKAAFYGWQQEALSKNADDIRKLGLELHERVVAVAKNLDALGQRLTQAVEAYNSTVYQTESQVLVTGRKLGKIWKEDGGKIIEPRLVHETPKPLTAPELKS